MYGTGRSRRLVNWPGGRDYSTASPALRRLSNARIGHLPYPSGIANVRCLTLRPLLYVLTIVDEGSFTRAAQRLYVAQPSLSKQLIALETELGVPLVERMHRSIRLTPAGRAFLPEARAATMSAERARRAARMAHDLEAGEIEVATVLSIAIGLLPGSIRTLRDRHPRIVVN